MEHAPWSDAIFSQMAAVISQFGRSDTYLTNIDSAVERCALCGQIDAARGKVFFGGVIVFSGKGGSPETPSFR
jgi:hypothetical protein